MSCGLRWLLTVICLSITAAGSGRPWIEIHSPNFRVITDGTERDGRHVAREFEQMRAVFASQFPGLRLDSAAPFLILAAKDENTARKLLPELWNQPGAKPAGVYRRGWEKEYALVRLDVLDSDRRNPDRFAVVYHEYVHSLLHTNFRWLPTWLDEGLAEFYAYTRFEGGHIFIGAPPKNTYVTALVGSRVLIPVQDFIQLKTSMFPRDEQKTHLFYAQAWALVHFLTFGPEMKQGDRVKLFFNSLQKGTDQKKAFLDSFGSFEDIDKAFGKYVLQFGFISGEIPSPAQADDKSFSTRHLSAAETEAELSAFYILSHRWNEVQGLAEAAVKDDPGLGLPHQNMGYFQFNEGKNEEALREFSKAFELDRKLYLSLFARTMLSAPSPSSPPADQETFHSTLLKVLDLKPNFAPAYVELAKFYVRQGDAPTALGLARRAEQLEPSRAGYHLLTGQILLRMGRPGDAATHAAYVANRWTSVDRDEALELWNSVPAALRPADALLPDSSSPAADRMEGLVKSVTCGDHSFTLVLERDGQQFSFNGGTRFGFADTHWWGADHFTPCFHVTGLRAVVHYKKSSSPSNTGDALNVGFRDDLPPFSGGKTQEAVSTETK